MTARVTFIKYYNYTIEVPDNSEESEDAAIDEAEMEFRADMRCPIADTTYDEVTVDWL